MLWGSPGKWRKKHRSHIKRAHKALMNGDLKQAIRRVDAACIIEGDMDMMARRFPYAFCSDKECFEKPLFVYDSETIGGGKCLHCGEPLEVVDEDWSYPTAVEICGDDEYSRRL